MQRNGKRLKEKELSTNCFEMKSLRRAWPAGQNAKKKRYVKIKFQVLVLPRQPGPKVLYPPFGCDCGRGRFWTLRSFVRHRIDLPFPQIQPLCLLLIQRARPSPPKHRQLIPRLIHGPVTVDSLGDRQRRPLGARPCNQLRRGPWVEPREVCWVVPRRKNLQHTHPVLPISHEREC